MSKQLFYNFEYRMPVVSISIFYSSQEIQSAFAQVCDFTDGIGQWKENK